mgnify:CR=1 FL=1
MSSASVKAVVAPSDKSNAKPVNPSEKKEKRLKKKIRTKEQRFQETKDQNYLRERDQAQDELNELLLSRATAKKNKKIKSACAQEKSTNHMILHMK